MKRNLQNDMYENIDKVVEALDLLKTKYMKQGPKFSGKSEIFAEVNSSLMHKAADFLTITSRKESDINFKKLKERVEELEREKLMMKSDFAADKKGLEVRLQEVEGEKNNAIRNEKLLEERMKYLSEDKDKQEKNINDKWNQRL